ARRRRPGASLFPYTTLFRSLGLEAAVRGRRLARAGQRRRPAGPVLAALRGGRTRQALLARLAFAGAPTIGRRRPGHVGQQVVGLERARPCVVVLEQEPLRLAGRLSGAHQVPAAPQLAAEELEATVSLGELLACVAFRGPVAAVEAGDMSPAVPPLRDLSLDCRIADRMVLDLDRHPLDARVVA